MIREANRASLIMVRGTEVKSIWSDVNIRVRHSSESETTENKASDYCNNAAFLLGGHALDQGGKKVGHKHPSFTMDNVHRFFGFVNV